MKKIVFFGDSYANYEWVPYDISHLTWHEIISSNLELPIINYGTSGTGLNYSMSKFLEYINSENYDSNDIIIWITSHEQRLYTRSMTSPHLGTFHNFSKDKIKKLGKDDRAWIEENSEHAVWAMENYYDPSINYSILKVVSFLKQWCIANKNNTVVLLKGQCFLPGGGDINDLLRYMTEGKNFFPILEHKHSLDMISYNEFSTEELYKYMLSNKKGVSPGIDRRVNHLSYVNRCILARQLTEIIANRSLAYWNRDEYKSSIYSSTEQIDKTGSKFF
jgi:hypothetical protein